jgi:hypothetical protein
VQPPREQAPRAHALQRSVPPTPSTPTPSIGLRLVHTDPYGALEEGHHQGDLSEGQRPLLLVELLVVRRHQEETKYLPQQGVEGGVKQGGEGVKGGGG